MAAFHCRRYRFPAELEDVVVALLGASGTLGLQHVGFDGSEATEPHVPGGRGPSGGVSDGGVSEDVQSPSLMVEAYFPIGETPSLPLPPSVELLQVRDVPEEDWLENYRLRAQPLEVGERFRIDPREPELQARAAGDSADSSSRTTIRVPARQAFGTGSHETTRLALELLENAGVAGRRLLDVGTGSGILSFAALSLGASQAVGFDVDLPSSFLAGQYRALNPWAPQFFGGSLAALSDSACFDIAAVNILPERILHEIACLGNCLADRSEVILSGILESRGDEVLQAYEPLGFSVCEQRQEGEWVAFRCRR